MYTTYLFVFVVRVSFVRCQSKMIQHSQHDTRLLSSFSIYCITIIIIIILIVDIQQYDRIDFQTPQQNDYERARCKLFLSSTHGSF